MPGCQVSPPVHGRGDDRAGGAGRGGAGRALSANGAAPKQTPVTGPAAPSDGQATVPNRYRWNALR
jgi:hypothetical protein